MDGQELVKLCDCYGYRFDELGCYIRIISNRDTWYILNINYCGHKIELKHENTKGKAYMHSHGKHSSLKDIFKCIYSHDNREMIRNNKTMKLLNILNTIQI